MSKDGKWPLVEIHITDTHLLTYLLTYSMEIHITDSCLLTYSMEVHITDSYLLTPWSK
jgi:hypothetical protein